MLYSLVLRKVCPESVFVPVVRWGHRDIGCEHAVTVRLSRRRRGTSHNGVGE